MGDGEWIELSRPMVQTKQPKRTSDGKVIVGTCEVIFEPDAPPMNDKAVTDIENRFIRFYQIYVDHINPRIKEWNNLYSGEMGPPYDYYMMVKAKGVIDRYLLPEIQDDRYFKNFFIGSDLVLCAELYGNRYMSIIFHYPR